MKGNEVSVGVSISGSTLQRHLGFEVVDGGDTYIYHLAFHCLFRKETPAEYSRDSLGYFRVALANFTSHEMMHIYRHLNVIYARNGRNIPYGFNFVADSVLTRDGVVPLDLPPGSGLTCATFVLQVLRNQDFDIIDLDSWESRSDDAEWQSRIIEALRAWAPPAHVESLLQCIGVAVRFRPEEVAGCARQFDEEPIKFPDGVVLGQQICQEMQQHGLLATE